MTELFCPQCEYNLTGLTQDLCPECGRPFDREEIARLAASAPKPISATSVTVQMVVPPLICAVLVPVLFATNLEFLFGTLVLALAIFSVLQGVNTPSRIHVTRAVAQGRPAYSRRKTSVVILSMLGWLWLQTILAYVACWLTLTTLIRRFGFDP